MRFQRVKDTEHQGPRQTAKEIMTRDHAQGSPKGALDARAGLASHSRLVQRLRRRYADELSLLAPGTPDAARMIDCLAQLRARGHDTGAALRILRQLVMERLVVLDCEQDAPLHEVTGAVTTLAEIALNAACDDALAELDARHGAPLTESGARARLWVMGMGKLGARELNVSSDVDLIYLYDEDGQSAGRADGGAVVSTHEYFTRAARRIGALIGDVTEHGFVFRVDLALRPNGNSGPIACSLEALEEYTLVQGREWERFAWLKARAVAPRSAIDGGAAEPLRAVVLPFVFRKYLDYSVFESLRVLHRQIREHASRRSAGRPERTNDVKLSRGGIREIEFTVQLLQVVRGGQYPELRTRPTLQALQRVARAGLMPQATADALASAYTFLRRVEHRIQYLDDQQTHVLPTRDDDLDWLAHTLGYDSTCAFLGALDAHRETVAEEFDRLLGGSVPCKTCGRKTSDPAPTVPQVNDLADVPALIQRPAVAEALARWCQTPAVQGLRESTRQRLLQLFARTAGWLGEGRIEDNAVLRFIDWIDTLLRRESYLALLLERPAVHERLLRVLGMARWPARYVMQHPGVIDELANPSLLAQRFDPVQLEHELEERRRALAKGGEDDEENLMGLLRRANQAEVFRTLVRDVERRITVEQVADDLSALADAILRITVRWCWALLRQRHRDDPRLGLIAYGKLGGKELGYGGDLDLVFVFDDDDERAPEIYAAFVRKLITWLTLQTGEGHLYDIDTALRPNGSSGLLVTHFDAYADYQQQRGSNTAWTWEHQAMTRARMVPPKIWPPRSPASQGPLPPEGAAVCLGSGPAADGVTPSSSGTSDAQRADMAAPFDLTARFDAVRHAVLTAPRDRAALRAEIVEMRRKMHAAHPVRDGLFDLKHSAGGMVDAEFVTQYLVLAHTAEHPGLEPNLGNIALLIRAEQAGLLPPGVGQAGADAYRSLRFAQHIGRLDEQPTQVVPEPLATERAAITALWQAVFG